MIENKEVTESLFKIPFLKKVYAEEVVSNSYTTALAIGNFIEEMTMGNPDIEEALMTLILQKNNTKLEETNNEIKNIKEEAPELLRPETLLAIGGDKLMEMAGAEKLYTFDSMEGAKPVSVKIRNNKIEKEDEIKVSKIHQEVKQEIINKDKREKMIEKIKVMQNSGEATGANLLIMFTGEFAGEMVYNKVIESFTDVLEENKDKMKGETYHQLDSVLQNDLEEILGSKKTAFANRFLNSSAEDIVNSFANWVNNSINRKDLEINKNTLISALDAMGFEHEGELEEVINDIASNEEGMDGDLHSDESSDQSINLEGKEEVLLDYLSYMLPFMDYVDQEDLKTLQIS